MARIQLTLAGQYKANNPITEQPFTSADTITLVPGMHIPVAYWKVPVGADWEIPTIIVPFFMKLYDADGIELPPETRIYIGVRGPVNEQIKELGSETYFTWSMLSLVQQMSKDYSDRCAFELELVRVKPEVQAVGLRSDERLYLLLEIPVGFTPVVFKPLNSHVSFFIEEKKA